MFRLYFWAFTKSKCFVVCLILLLFQNTWKKFTKRFWKLKVQSFLNLDAVAGELKSSAPPPMNSMLDKLCKTIAQTKPTKTCPSYVTKQGGQSKICSGEPNYKKKGLKHMLGSRAGLSLLYTTKESRQTELEKLDLQDNNNYMFMFILFICLHVHFFAKTNEICTLNPARLCWNIECWESYKIF